MRLFLLRIGRGSFNCLCLHKHIKKYQEFQGGLNQVRLNAEVNGIWLTIWKDGIYTSSRYSHQSFKDVVISKIYLAFVLAK
jgi:hypothetical protein